MKGEKPLFFILLIHNMQLDEARQSWYKYSDIENILLDLLLAFHQLQVMHEW